MALTIKQQKFIDEYLKCFNATKAAELAGYNANNGTLAAIGYENLRKPQIKDAIELHLKESAMSRDEVLMRLAIQARANIADFADIQSSADLVNLGDAAYPVKKMKKRITHTKDGEMYEDIEIELHDSQSALDKIGKRWAIFTERIEHTGKGGGPIEITEMRSHQPDE